MRNTHTSVTDRPSKLIYSKVRENGGITYKFVYSPEAKKCNNGLLSGQRDIHITDNSPFGDQDFVFNTFNKTVYKIVPDDSPREILASPKNIILGALNDKLFFRIILTTDPDLIEAGVQPIEDGFIEWFAKNPTEKVGVTEISRCCGRCNGIDDLCYADMTCDLHHKTGCDICYGRRVKYQLEMAREEIQPEDVFNDTKRESIKAKILAETTEETKQKARAYGDSLVGSKQITPEEAALNYSKKFLDNGENSEFEAQAALIGFLEGYNLAQKQSYTLDQISKDFVGEGKSGGYFDDYLDYRITSDNKITFKEWFKTQKKK
jgi:hypothetical protein